MGQKKIGDQSLFGKENLLGMRSERHFILLLPRNAKPCRNILRGNTVIEIETSKYYYYLSPAVILNADRSIGVKPGAVHTLISNGRIQYWMAEFNIEWQNSILPLGQQSDP